MTSSAALSASVEAAVEGWLTIDPTRVPAEVTCLQASKKARVFRLVGARRDGRDVIAKRGFDSEIEVEISVYRDVLPYLGVSSLQFLGTMQDGPTYRWIYMEDAGTDWYQPGDASHRALAGAWLAQMHARAALEIESVTLPDRGARFYREQLGVVRKGLREALELDMPSGGAHVLHRALRELDLVNDFWLVLEAMTQAMPTTLVHGDFVSKNVRVRTDAPGGIYAMDWELAGWGFGAIDLRHIDRDVYTEVSRRQGWCEDREVVEELCSVGQIFRGILAMNWTVSNMAGVARGRSEPRIKQWLEGLIELVEIYTDRLRESFSSLSHLDGERR